MRNNITIPHPETKAPTHLEISSCKNIKQSMINIFSQGKTKERNEAHKPQAGNNQILRIRTPKK